MCLDNIVADNFSATWWHMKCKIDDCCKDAMYLGIGVCQMHYFRMMRTGSYDLKKRVYEMKPRKKVVQSAGYILIYDPDHKLAQKNGYVYEHRKVMYEIYGENTKDCELCGKKTSWDLYTTHIDHINHDKSDNSPDNLRFLCNACNSQRDVNVHDRGGITLININGEVKTAGKWGKHPLSNHTGASIYRRYKNGMDPYECVFGKNITHPKRKDVI